MDDLSLHVVVVLWYSGLAIQSTEKQQDNGHSVVASLCISDHVGKHKG